MSTNAQKIFLYSRRNPDWPIFCDNAGRCVAVREGVVLADVDPSEFDRCRIPTIRTVQAPSTERARPHGSLLNSASSWVLAEATGTRVGPERRAARLAVCRGDDGRPRCPYYGEADGVSRCTGCGCRLRAEGVFKNLAAFEEKQPVKVGDLGWGCPLLKVVDGVERSRWQRAGA